MMEVCPSSAAEDDPPDEVRVKCDSIVLKGGCLARRKRDLGSRLHWDPSLQAAREEEEAADGADLRLAQGRLRKAQRLFADGSQLRSERYLLEHFDTRMLGITRAVDELARASQGRSRGALLSILTAHFPVRLVPFTFDISGILGQLLLEVRDFEWLHTKLNHILMCDPRVDHSPFADMYDEVDPDSSEFHASYSVFTPAQLFEKADRFSPSTCEEDSAVACHTASEDDDSVCLDDEFGFSTDDQPRAIDDFLAGSSALERSSSFEAPEKRGMFSPFGLRIRAVSAYVDLLRALRKANANCILLGLVIDEVLDSLAPTTPACSFSSSTLAPDGDDSEDSDQSFIMP